MDSEDEPTSIKLNQLKHKHHSRNNNSNKTRSKITKSKQELFNSQSLFDSNQTTNTDFNEFTSTSTTLNSTVNFTGKTMTGTFENSFCTDYSLIGDSYKMQTNQISTFSNPYNSSNVNNEKTKSKNDNNNNNKLIDLSQDYPTDHVVDQNLNNKIQSQNSINEYLFDDWISKSSNSNETNLNKLETNEFGYELDKNYKLDSKNQISKNNRRSNKTQAPLPPTQYFPN